VPPPVFLQDDDDDHRHCRAKAVPLEARGFSAATKLYTNAYITQAWVFAGPNGLFDGEFMSPSVLSWSRFMIARS
jgi:hypothetical protein